MATIVQELKKLIAARGGETTGIQTIAQAVKTLTALESEEESSDTTEENPSTT